jgi:hypothetical protein
MVPHRLRAAVVASSTGLRCADPAAVVCTFAEAKSSGTPGRVRHLHGGSSSNPPPVNAAEIVGGPEKRTIVIVDPDPAWVRRFDAERERIVGALGPVAVRVDHIGSTAIPGLAAKPVVDIQVSVPEVEHEDSYVPGLVRAGYELRVRESGHRMLRTPERDTHVHVCDHGGAWERRHLLFRD